MQAQLRRVSVRIDVTTAQGERRTLTVGARPNEALSSGVLLHLVREVMAQSGLELVNELEQPVAVVQPSAAALTAPVAVVAPEHLPSPAVLASPSATQPATGDLAPARKRSHAPALPPPATPAAPVKHVVADAHRRIEPTRNNRADVVIGPRDTPPIGGAQRVGTAVVVGQVRAPHQPSAVAAVASVPNDTAAVIKRGRT